MLFIALILGLQITGLSLFGGREEALADAQATLSLRDAVEEAVTTHPKVLEAAANQRSVTHELGQARGAYLPSLDIDGGIGPQFVDKPNSLSSDYNARWQAQKELNITLRQTLFNGFERASEVYRQGARINAAAARVMERAELIGLDAVEAFIDVKRHQQILAAMERNLAYHREILTRVWSNFRGGSSTTGDLRQAEERLAAVEVFRADIRQELDAAKARFESVIGAPPVHLGKILSPNNVPTKQGAALMLARSAHPALSAGQSDVETASAALDKAGSGFLPHVGVEGRASFAHDSNGIPGRSQDFAARLTLSWNIFDGGIKQQRQRQLGEKITESKMRLDDLRRRIDETVRRSFAEIATSEERVTAARKQKAAAGAVRQNYDQEYEAGLRNLLELLQAQNGAFSAEIQLISAESVAVFSRYRLLAAMGQLLTSLGIEPPDEATGLAENTSSRLVGGAPLIEPLRKW